MWLNKEQQKALKRVYDRTPLDGLARAIDAPSRFSGKLSYLAFRRRVRPAFGDTCVMVYWCGMWLGIEQDGYTHS